MSDKEKKLVVKTETVEFPTRHVEDLFYFWDDKHGVPWKVVCPLCGGAVLVHSDLSGKHLASGGDVRVCVARFDPSTGNCLLPIEEVPHAVARRLKGANAH